MNMKTVLIMGASGNFGSHAATAFEAAGWQVRRYQRGTDIAQAAAGVQVVVNALNPPNYKNWAENVPQIAALGLKAARASGATLVVPGNVYNFGTAPAPWGPDTPQNPQTRKGKLRVQMEQALKAATDVRVIVLRCGDFINPTAPGAVFDIVLAKSIAKGKLTALGDVAAAHSWAYLPDVARALVGLVEIRAELPRFADIPFAGHTLSVNDIAGHYGRILGRPVKVAAFPWWVMRLLSPVWRLANELLEMRYLASHPHWMSDAALNMYLPEFEPTPVEEMLRAAKPNRRS